MLGTIQSYWDTQHNSTRKLGCVPYEKCQRVSPKETDMEQTGAGNQKYTRSHLMELNGFQHQSMALASSKMERKIYPRIPFVSRPQECQFRHKSGAVVKNLLASAEDTGDVG